ncbi:MAG: T9SS type A sorting domain-containing protein, partial [Paludibacter sp.]
RNIDHNCFFGNHPSTEPADAHKVTADPLFVNPGSGGIGLNTVDGYKLKTGSPCINSGIYIPKNGGKDYWGNTVGIGKPDMGAYESPGITASVTLNSDKPTILIGQNKENPGILNLNISGTKISDTVSVKITSMNGKTLFNQKYQPLAQILIDTKSVLIKGVYIVSVDVEDKTEIRKIVIK